jgi:hypothetical protein
MTDIYYRKTTEELIVRGQPRQCARCPATCQCGLHNGQYLCPACLLLLAGEQGPGVPVELTCEFAELED